MSAAAPRLQSSTAASCYGGEGRRPTVHRKFWAVQKLSEYLFVRKFSSEMHNTFLGANSEAKLRF